MNITLQKETGLDAGTYELTAHTYAAAGQIALRLYYQGAPQMTVTRCVPDLNLTAKQIIIKTTEENSGIYEALVENDIIDAPYDSIQSGYILLRLVTLTDNAWKELGL